MGDRDQEENFQEKPAQTSLPDPHSQLTQALEDEKRNVPGNRGKKFILKCPSWKESGDGEEVDKDPREEPPRQQQCMRGGKKRERQRKVATAALRNGRTGCHIPAWKL